MCNLRRMVKDVMVSIILTELIDIFNMIKKETELDKTKSQDIYLRKLRMMSGEERMKRAFEMCRVVWKIAEDSIRNEFPDISDEELRGKLKERLHK
jgi:hypothetical protein